MGKLSLLSWLMPGNQCRRFSVLRIEYKMPHYFQKIRLAGPEIPIRSYVPLPTISHWVSRQSLPDEVCVKTDGAYQDMEMTLHPWGSGKLLQTGCENLWMSEYTRREGVVSLVKGAVDAGEDNRSQRREAVAQEGYEVRCPPSQQSLVLETTLP